MEQTLLTSKDLLSHPDIPFRSFNTIKAHYEKGDFPKPIHFGPRHLRWKKSDIDAWLDKCMSASGIQAA